MCAKIEKDIRCSIIYSSEALETSYISKNLLKQISYIHMIDYDAIIKSYFHFKYIEKYLLYSLEKQDTKLNI